MKGAKLAAKCNVHDENAKYWTNGKAVFYLGYEVKGADIDSFEQFPGNWAKDKKHCYSVGCRLRGADPATFEVLNYTYARDCNNVWTLGGRIAEADAETFEVCDSGMYSLGRKFKWSPEKQKIWYELFVPHGYGKDRNNVYYYNFDGKPRVVKKAIPASFQSLGDGEFGFDEKSVFHELFVIPKANPATWSKLHEDYNYSRDLNRIYYLNRLMKDADAETFEVVVSPVATGKPAQYAKDRNTAWWNGRPMSFEELEENLAKERKHYEDRKPTFGK
jgi:hypothetical protein